jgi:hypothetical protein
MTPRNNEGKSWQQVALSAVFAVLLLVAGWLYSSYNEKQNQLSNEFNAFRTAQLSITGEQNARIAVLENEIKNFKEVMVRMEAQGGRVESKLDQIIRR